MIFHAFGITSRGGGGRVARVVGGGGCGQACRLTNGCDGGPIDDDDDDDDDVEDEEDEVDDDDEDDDNVDDNDDDEDDNGDDDDDDDDVDDSDSGTDTADEDSPVRGDIRGERIIVKNGPSNDSASRDSSGGPIGDLDGPSLGAGGSLGSGLSHSTVPPDNSEPAVRKSCNSPSASIENSLLLSRPSVLSCLNIENSLSQPCSTTIRSPLLMTVM